MRRFASIATVFALTSCSHIPAVPSGARYVAMGSSFASGPGIGTRKVGSPDRCWRSDANYPALAARQLGLELVDVSCSGATTSHLLGRWDELPPQIEAVTPETRLVTITIGGNDLGYVRSLYLANCRATARQNRSGIEQCARSAVPTPEARATLRANLAGLMRALHDRASNARIVFVTYLTLVPDHACSAAPLDSEDRALAHTVAADLLLATVETAKQTGAEVLRADLLSRRHTPCDRQPWATGMPVGFDMRSGAPWHPNAQGMQALASALVERLR